MREPTPGDSARTVEATRFPGYDVLRKRGTPSFDQLTARVVEERLATPREPRFLDAQAFAVAQALCARILPQDGLAEPAPLAAMLDAKLLADWGDGFRQADMPYMRDAWTQGLAALDAEAKARHDGAGFAALLPEQQDALLLALQRGEAEGERWAGLGAQAFFERRVLADIPSLFYSHPSAWSEMGFGGPASPRGYVRLDERRDPWEAAEATPGREAEALRKNLHAV